MGIRIVVDREDIKRRVLEATDIVHLVGEHVALRARGREFVGLCPFHDDKRPSMCVVPAKQIFKCFACGAGGDAFSFMTRYHAMSFPEALRTLAERANIELPRYSGQAGGGSGGDEPSARTQVLKANDFAAAFFANQLADPAVGKDARAYVAQRGINAEMIAAFRIGYAPDSWDTLTKHVAAKRHDPRAFAAADLLRSRDDGSHYDRFRHRLMFPIIDSLNRTIAFGGRKLREEDEPKYLNSGETVVFDKSATLFGMHRAQKAILDSRTAVIVEGYTDVIAAHQAGFNNAVATLGTALTPQHAKLLRRYADVVVLIFDADEAGQKAADRAVSVFFREPIDVKIAVLPDGLDPADLLAKNDGPRTWQAAIDNAADALAFQFERVRHAFEKATTLAARHRIIEDHLRTLVQLGLTQLEPSRRGLVMASVADLIRLDVSEVDRIVRTMSAKVPRPHRAADEGPAVVDPTDHSDLLDAAAPPRVDLTKAAAAERHLVGALLNRPALLHTHLPDGLEVAEAVVPADLADDVVSRVYHALYDWVLDAESVADAPLTAADLRDLLTHEHLVTAAIDLQMEVDRLADGSAETIAAQLLDAAAELRRRRDEHEYRRQKMEARDRTAQSGAAEDPAEQARRLDLAIAHMNANPSAKRTPRIAGKT